MNGGMNGLITALAIAPDGSIYAGGSFTTAGGNSAMRIAKWNGTTWYNLSTGVSGAVAALAVAPDGTLYAGGILRRREELLLTALRNGMERPGLRWERGWIV